MKRCGVTLVELLLAMALALVGITMTLVLAGEIVAASARMRRRHIAQAPARLALERLRAEITAASTFSTREGPGIATTLGTQKLRWQVVPIEGTPSLVRHPAGLAPTRSHVVARPVYALGLQQAARAVTLAMTVGEGPYRQRLGNVIRQWGVTL